MRPYLFQLGSHAIPAYPTLYGLGLVVTCLVAERLARARGEDGRKMVHLLAIASLCVPLGGRAFYALQHLDAFTSGQMRFWDFSKGGLVHYGGLILALVAAWLVTKILRMNGAVAFDALTVGAPLGLAFGRIGCFFEGCCYGKPATSWFAVSFPRYFGATGDIVGAPVFMRQVQLGLIGEEAVESLPVHPSQLYEATVSLGLFAIMLLLWKRDLVPGRLLGIYIMAYTLVRFLLEYSRDNETGWLGLTIPQWTGVPVFVCAGLYVVLDGRLRPMMPGMSRRLHDARPSTAAGPSHR